MKTVLAAIGAAALGLVAGALLEYTKGWLTFRQQRAAKAEDLQLATLSELQVACVDLFTRAQDGLEERKQSGDELSDRAHAELYAAHMQVELLRERVDDLTLRTLADDWSDRAYRLGSQQAVADADAEWDAVHRDFISVNRRVGVAIRAARQGKQPPD
jgi:uncharacterized membrane protein YccC